MLSGDAAAAARILRAEQNYIKTIKLEVIGTFYLPSFGTYSRGISE